MSQCLDPDWHESNLLIQLMNGGSLPRKELLNRVREEQSKKKVLGEVGITHSKSAYAYWLRHLIADQVAVESEGGPRLTPLGEWIANSELGTVEDKYLFVCNATCSDCRKKDGYIVILKLERGTAISDAKRRLFANVECPRCGKKERKHLYEGFSVDRFIRFYDQALSELTSTARRMPQLVLS
jgi:hypothetical protein